MSELKSNYTWDPDSPYCVSCGEPMQLNEGCEWHDDPTMNLCHPCALGELEDLRKPQSSTWPAVLAFARLMDARLQANLDLGNREEWRDRSKHLLASEVLQSAMASYRSVGHPVDDKQTVQDYVDLANYALFIADACGGLNPVQKSNPGEGSSSNI